MRMWHPFLVAAAMTGMSGPAAEAQEAIGMKLEAAGFVMKEANTPKKMDRLKTLPAHKFVKRVKNGVAYYIYPDPTYCKCALIGRQDAMNSYRDMVKPMTPPPGYREFAGNMSGSGDNIDSEMMNDMSEDGESGMESDIFYPGF